MIFLSDIHLSSKPPLARSDEPDWQQAMLRSINQLKDLQQERQCDIICAGDVFDKWNPNPALINFAIANLPHMYAIPGQHDLPNHRYDDIKQSAYWTLVEAGIITNLDPQQPHQIGDQTTVHAFPWGFDLKPCEADDDKLHVLVAHRFLWIKSHGYVHAPTENRLAAIREIVSTYDIAHFGDNHQGFLIKLGEMVVINTGTFFLRKADEKNYRPRVGILDESGQVRNHYLDVTEDILLETTTTNQTETDFQLDSFLAELQQLESDPLDFLGLVNEQQRRLPPATQALLQEILHDAQTTRD